MTEPTINELMKKNEKQRKALEQVKAWAIRTFCSQAEEIAREGLGEDAENVTPTDSNYKTPFVEELLDRPIHMIKTPPRRKW